MDRQLYKNDIIVLNRRGMVYECFSEWCYKCAC